MTHRLISFLGKARKLEGGTYRQANYRFDDNTTITSQFFGLALNDVIKPDQLIILGTSGSMWDVFYEHLAKTEQQQQHWLELTEAVEDNRVKQDMLDICAQDLSDQLGMPCLFALIPYGINTEEQTRILEIIVQNIQSGDPVSLDLTHGLRHLPMLGLLSAMYLKTARQVDIKGLYYGALELTENAETPVMNLDGMLKIADWINALQGFDKTGDIAPFSTLMQQEGMAKVTADLLKQAAFFENTLSITKARRPLRDFAGQTKDGLPGIARLFEDSLKQRIAWKDQNNIYLRQRHKALFYLKQGDYLRAAALGYEAYITRHIKQHRPSADPENFDCRESAKITLKDTLTGEEKKYFKLLNNLRNALAHGTRSEIAGCQAAMSDERRLKMLLNDLFDALLPDRLD